MQHNANRYNQFIAIKEQEGAITRYVFALYSANYTFKAKYTRPVQGQNSRYYNVTVINFTLECISGPLTISVAFVIYYLKASIGSNFTLETYRKIGTIQMPKRKKYIHYLLPLFAVSFVVYRLSKKPTGTSCKTLLSENTFTYRLYTSNAM